MKIHEYQAAELFQKAGIPVVQGGVAMTVEEAVGIAAGIGYPVVLKSQVLVGGRGKAGGIRKVRDRAALEKAFPELKALRIKDYAVEKILVARAIHIHKEFYAGMIVDCARNDVVLMASSAGGVDIEETARTHPEAIHKYYLQGDRRPAGRRWEDFLRSVFPEPSQAEQAGAIFRSLIGIFFAYDCSLAEINPLVVDEAGRMSAADAKINFDDNALFRHEDIRRMQDARYEDPDEMKAREQGLSFVKLDGNVGCIVNGAGLAMATMDVIKLAGGRPANFLDVGGSSNPEKVLHALQIILRNRDVRVILMNIFGGITRCDDIARGILEAQKRMAIPVPLVVRLIGTNEPQAKALLAQEKINTYSTMREAVEKAVALAG